AIFLMAMWPSFDAAFGPVDFTSSYCPAAVGHIGGLCRAVRFIVMAPPGSITSLGHINLLLVSIVDRAGAHLTISWLNQGLGVPNEPCFTLQVLTFCSHCLATSGRLCPVPGICTIDSPFVAPNDMHDIVCRL